MSPRWGHSLAPGHWSDPTLTDDHAAGLGSKASSARSPVRLSSAQASSLVISRPTARPFSLVDPPPSSPRPRAGASASRSASAAACRQR